MRTIKLIIEYDGTAYAGWQVQANGVAVQQVVENALGIIVGAPVRLYSSGRTDAGVHARGMVAVFRTDLEIPLTAFSDGLNVQLPPDISIHHAEEMPDTFDPRRDAKAKLYRYTINTSLRRSPLTRHYAWHLRTPLNLDGMRSAAVQFLGEHDFAAFRTSGCAARTTKRRIERVEITQEHDVIKIAVVGSGFLRNMVRIMVGTLVAVGQGKREVESIAGLLADPTAGSAGPTAPAHGLCLVEVYY
jgi:tRNA pseudouridine38-40 synthase